MDPDRPHPDDALLPVESAETLPPGGEEDGRDAPPAALGRSAIGPYRLLRELGRGGQGIVYLAEDMRLSRRVALKVIAPQFAPSGSTLARFRREAANASRLDHPGICAVYEAGEAEGFHYIAMRYVEGTTLAQGIEAARNEKSGANRTIAVGGGGGRDDGDGGGDGRADTSGRSDPPRLPSTRDDVFAVIRLIERAARALHSAHEAGLIHRDIKPGNIMVTREGDPVILDFGLAREEEGSGPSLTVSGDLLGTPAYMSPEQIAAHRIPLDRRTDIYSLGVTLYECLTLRRPFDAPTRDAIYQQILAASPPDPRKLNAHVPPDLKVVLATAMERDRNRRYKAALDFAEDLRRIRDFEPIRARPAGPVLRFRRWVQRNPVLATATLGLFLLLTTGLAISLVLLRQVNEQKEAASAALVARERALEAQEAALAKERDALALVRRERDEKQRALDDRETALVAERAALDRVRDESRAKEEALAKLQEALDAVQAERDKARGLYLTGQASSVLGSNPGQALLLAIAGAERYPGPLASHVLVQALVAPREDRVLRGHGNPVIQALWIPGGKLAAGVTGAEVRLWNVESGELVGLLPATVSYISRAEIDPTGRLLAAALGNGALDLWELPAGKRRLVLQGHTPGVEISAVRFNAPGTALATASRDGTVRVWSTEDGAPLSPKIAAHHASVAELAFSPDGARLLTTPSGVVYEYELDAQGRATGSYRYYRSTSPTTACVWDIAGGEELLRIGGLHRAVQAASWTEGGQQLVTACERSLSVSDAATGEEVRSLAWRRPGHRFAVLSPDSRRCARLNFQGELVIADVETAYELCRISGVHSRVAAPAFSPDGRRIAAAVDDQSIGVFNVETGARIVTLRGHATTIRSIAFAPDGRRLLTASSDGTLGVWAIRQPVEPGPRNVRGSIDLAQLQADMLERRIGDLLGPAFGASVQESAFSGDGNRCLADFYSELLVLDTARGEVAARIAVGAPDAPSFSFFQAEPIAALAFTADGEGLATVFRSGEVRIWDSLGEKDRTPADLPATFNDLDFTGDGRLVVLADFDGNLHVASIAEGEVLAELSAEGVRLSLPRFIAGGSKVAAVGSDGTVRVWESATGASLAVHALPGERGELPEIAAPAWRDDRILFARASGSPWILDAGSGQSVLDIQGAPPAVHAEFARDGSKILLLAAAGAVEVLDATTGSRMLQLAGPDRAFDAATLSATGERVLTISRRGRVSVWNVATGELTFEPELGSLSALSAELDRDGDRLLVLLSDGSHKLWEPATGMLLLEIPRGPELPAAAVLRPDGARLLTLLHDGTAVLRDTADGSVVREVRKVRLGPPGVAERWFGRGAYTFDHEGKRLLGVSYSRRSLRVWDLEARRLLWELADDARRIDSAFLSPDGRRVVVGFSAGQHAQSVALRRVLARQLGCAVLDTGASAFEVRDAESGVVVGSLSGPEKAAAALAISPGSTRVGAVAGQDAFIWDLASGEPVVEKRFPASCRAIAFRPDAAGAFVLGWGNGWLWDFGGDQVVDVTDVSSTSSTSLTDPVAAAFDPLGRWLAVPSRSGTTCHIVEVASGTKIGTLGELPQAINAVSWSPDGEWLATGSRDGKARVWKVGTWQEWVVFPYAAEVRAVQFSEDGHFLLAALKDGLATPHAWPLDVLATAQGEVARSLTPEERDRFEIGTAEERAAYRQEWNTREACGFLRVAARFAVENPEFGGDIQRVVAHFDRIAQEVASSEAGRYSSQLGECVADVLRTTELTDWRVVQSCANIATALGDHRSAVFALEKALVVPGAPRALESALEASRRALLPDLVSYASIDAAFDYWEPLVEEGDSWRFFRGRSEPSPALEWTALEFDDGSWEEGPSGFGYGDGDDATVLEDMRGAYTTVYARRVFEVADPERLRSLRLSVRVDDGCVAYLNGTEILRSRAGRAGERQAFDAVADSYAADRSEEIESRVDTELIRAGRNVLAVQGLNRSSSSSDLTLVPVVEARFEGMAERGRERLERFREVARGGDARQRVAYLDALLLERAGDHAGAARLFEDVWRLAPGLGEPLLGLARCLRAGGDASGAAFELQRGLRALPLAGRELWDLWYEISLVELGMEPRAVLEVLEEGARRPAHARARRLAEALRGILEDGTLRINCGGDEYRDARGRKWEADRFFSSGRASAGGGTDLAGTEDDALFAAHRTFIRRLPGPYRYRIPLPKGTYRVALHISETRFTAAGERRFDVAIEGGLVLDEFSPTPATIETRTFATTVVDGFLEIDFVPGKDNPLVSAIEVEKTDAE